MNERIKNFDVNYGDWSHWSTHNPENYILKKLEVTEQRVYFDLDVEDRKKALDDKKRAHPAEPSDSVHHTNFSKTRSI